MRVFITTCVVLFAVATGIFCSGCATNVFPGGPSIAGMIYTDVKVPSQNLAVATDVKAGQTKMGKSSADAFLGIFAGGDASVDMAMKNGKITNVHHVDHQVQMFLLGLWARSTTIVYGE